MNEKQTNKQKKINEISDKKKLKYETANRRRKKKRVIESEMHSENKNI